MCTKLYSFILYDTHMLSDGYNRWQQDPPNRYRYWIILAVVSAVVLVIVGLAVTNDRFASLIGARVQVPPTEEAESHSRREIAASTNELREALRQYEQATPEEQLTLVSDLVASAQRRQQLIISAFAEDPAAIIDHAFSKEDKDKVPSEAQSFIEDNVELEGEYALMIGDDFENKKELESHELFTGEEKPLKLHVGKNRPTTTPGSRVRVKGVKVNSDVAVQEITATGDGGAQVEGILNTLITAADAQTTLPVPILNSLPNAPAKLFLDFNGRVTSSWGLYSNITTPPFDQDGDTTTFSSGEIAAIQEIWARVAEDYAPFNINVTTVDPNTEANRAVAIIAIGGSYSDWYGSSAGGVAYVGGFYNSSPNIGFVFENNLSSNTKYIGAAAAPHEAGHLFGLQHQAKWSGDTLVEAYNSGDGAVAPIMGVSYYATRSLWWSGPTSAGSTAIQDDTAILANSNNSFGFNVDDHESSVGSATSLTINGDQATGSGLLGQTGDVDYFSTFIEAGLAAFTVHVPPGINNLDAKLELRDSNGAVIAGNDPEGSFDATVSATVPTSGTYHLSVSGHGLYGDQGQYTITKDVGTVSQPSDTPTPTASPTPTGTPTSTPVPTITPTSTPVPNDTTPPVVNISSPANAAKITKNTNFSATAADSSGIKTITLAIDGSIKRTCTGATSCTFSIKPNTLSTGSHTLTATSTDNSAGANVGTKTITVTR